MRSVSDAYRAEVERFDFPKLSHTDLVALHVQATKHGDREAWRAMWMHGVRLVLKIANKFRRLGYIQTEDAYNECISAGNVAIGEALLKWNPSKARFGTWVWLMVRWAMFHELDAEQAQGGKNFQPGGLVTNDGHGEYEDFDEFLSEALTDEFMGDWFIDLSRLHEVLDQLPEREHDFVRRVYVEGQSQAQVAEDEDISGPMVNKVLARAINRLRDILD